jgi:hypothetical protein
MTLETDLNAGGPCPRCGKSAFYQCLECFSSPILCQQCIVNEHASQPLHQIRKWVSTHFETSSLHSLGLVVHLGHNGKPCPASAETNELTVVHTNGIHRCSVQFCDCNDITPNYQQLLLVRFFPATLAFPHTVFTFHVLTTFHQLSLCSKITPYDYFDTLKKLTNYAFPQEVDVRYFFSNHSLTLIKIRIGTES